MKATISVYILAYNEADKIKDAIESVRWADEIIVVDSFSTDGTQDIAMSLGAMVIEVPFEGFGKLRNMGIAACNCEWIFSLDSDERCTPDAAKEIQEVISNKDALDAYFIPRRNIFLGRWIKHSGFYPDYRQPQLFRKGVMEFKDDPVHEEYILHTRRPTGYLKSPIIQIPYKNLSQVLSKANRYSSLGAEKLMKKGKNPGLATALFHALWAFFHIFVIKGGFLDGWPGFIIALGNFEGTFYKYAKCYELQQGLTLGQLKLKFPCDRP